MKAKSIIPIFMAAGLILAAASATVNAVTTRQVRAEIPPAWAMLPFAMGFFRASSRCSAASQRTPRLAAGIRRGIGHFSLQVIKMGLARRASDLQ